MAGNGLPWELAFLFELRHYRRLVLLDTSREDTDCASIWFTVVFGNVEEMLGDFESACREGQPYGQVNTRWVDSPATTCDFELTIFAGAIFCIFMTEFSDVLSYAFSAATSNHHLALRVVEKFRTSTSQAQQRAQELSNVHFWL